jgi:hypothetical protein
MTTPTLLVIGLLVVIGLLGWIIDILRDILSVLRTITDSLSTVNVKLDESNRALSVLEEDRSH